MSRGNRLPGGGQDSFVVEFNLPILGPMSTDAAVTAETALSVGFMQSTTAANIQTEWTAPWPCRVAEVYSQGEFAAAADEMRIRVRRGTATAFTADDVINNGVGSATVDYVQLLAATADEFLSVRYDGTPQAESVGAEGFVEAEQVFAAGDRLSATYEMITDGDLASHVRVLVTMNRI